MSIIIDKRAACIAAAEDTELVFLEGFDDAIIGFAERDGDAVAVYCAKRLAGVLAKEGWSKEDANEHIGNNVLGAWIGPRTPVVLWKIR